MRNPHTMQLVAKRIGEKEFSEIDVPPADSHLNIVRHMYEILSTILMWVLISMTENNNKLL
ncbi:MAG: hypothetical protein CM1200mP24_02320 [Gammaproteobacteria bacterium]|nr:MAG: hypothetical protein CM1200mP24_02320 [Gammaproteobacteria bacterium]